MNYTNKKEIFIVAAIMLCAIFLRVLSFMHRGDVWLDELFSVYFINQDSTAKVLKSLWNEDVHAPLYFVFMHLIGKIFGAKIFVYRLFSTILSTLCVPLAYIVGKKIFNNKTGYIFSALLAINVFFIYHSIEIRFYGVLVLLSLLSSYFHVISLKEKKSYIGLLIANLLVIYTFNLGVFFVGLQYLTGILYLYFKREKISEYFKSAILTFALSIPMIIFLLKTIILYNGTLFSFAKDVFYFDLSFLYSLAITYFSNLFYNPANNLTWEYNYLLLFKPITIIFGIIPTILAITGIIKAIKDKNDRILIILIPSVIFILFETTMALFGKMGIVCRHTIIAFPAIIFVASYGISLIKSKPIFVGTLSTILVLQLLTPFVIKGSKLFVNYSFFNNLKADVQSLKLNNEDYILTPEIGYLYKNLFKEKYQYINLNVDKLCFYNDTKLRTIIFDKEINKTNKSEALAPYLKTDKPFINLRKYLTENYFKNLKNGQKICVIIQSPEERFINPSTISEEQYQYSLYQILINKINLEVITVLTQQLRLKQAIKAKDNGYLIFLFEK